MNETLKKYYGIFAEQLKKDRDVSELYRFEKISPECAYVYAGSEWSDGEYKRSVGKWQWGEDIRVLAMLVSEILLRALFMMPDGKELNKLPDVPCAEYIRGLGMFAPEVRERIAGFADEMCVLVSREDFSSAVFNDWGRRLDAYLRSVSDFGFGVQAFGDDESDEMHEVYIAMARERDALFGENTEEIPIEDRMNITVIHRRWKADKK